MRLILTEPSPAYELHQKPQYSDATSQTLSGDVCYFEQIIGHCFRWEQHWLEHAHRGPTLPSRAAIWVWRWQISLLGFELGADYGNQRV